MPTSIPNRSHDFFNIFLSNFHIHKHNLHCKTISPITCSYQSWFLNKSMGRFCFWLFDGIRSKLVRIFVYRLCCRLRHEQSTWEVAIIRSPMEANYWCLIKKKQEKNFSTFQSNYLKPISKYHKIIIHCVF